MYVLESSTLLRSLGSPISPAFRIYNLIIPELKIAQKLQRCARRKIAYRSHLFQIYSEPPRNIHPQGNYNERQGIHSNGDRNYLMYIHPALIFTEKESCPPNGSLAAIGERNPFFSHFVLPEFRYAGVGIFNAPPWKFSASPFLGKFTPCVYTFCSILQFVSHRTYPLYIILYLAVRIRARHILISIIRPNCRTPSAW